jgi:putative flippase GtrA
MNCPPQFAKYGLVGLLNTMIHAALLFGSVELLSLGPVTGNLVAFLVANMVSFMMNSYWTFNSSPDVRHYVKFFLSSLFALGLTLGIAWLFQALGLHYGLGFLGVILIVPPLNYLALKRWTFTAHL